MISWHRGYLVVVSSDMKGIPGYSIIIIIIINFLFIQDTHVPEVFFSGVLRF